jgi:cellulose synthase/poly-beta-1,6-N-acetylglucosamine synthase-like glycosyltransferase
MISIVDLGLICILAFVYLWVFYNLPILAVGVKCSFRARKTHKKEKVQEPDALPSFSIVIPAKNEGKVIGRLLDSITKLEYPKERLEIIVVEDGSTDNTVDVCNGFSSKFLSLRVLRRETSDGKPGALNFALKHCHGDILAVFDADNVPSPDALINSTRYFQNPNVAAVQGRTLSINSGQNMLTQFVSYEEAVWCEAYLRGKDSLKLFVHLKGSCQFIKREVLVRLGGFSEVTLSEDMELSARLTEKSYGIRYAGDVCTWQESPSTLRTMFRQRTRWFRGTMEVALKYGRLMSKPSVRVFDAEATLFGPFVIIASLLSTVLASGIFVFEFPYNLMSNVFALFSLIGTCLTLILVSLVLVCVSRQNKVRSLLWLPFVFGYWSVQGFVATYAACLIALRRPKKWERTVKNGKITGSHFERDGLRNASKA